MCLTIFISFCITDIHSVIMPEKVRILCSCPEYLTGFEKRNMKKKTACKQCKGLQLPMSSIGTVRAVSTSYGFDAPLPSQYCFATLRLPRSPYFDHQRQAFLCEHDPYKCLRQSQLLHLVILNLNLIESTGPWLEGISIQFFVG